MSAQRRPGARASRPAGKKPRRSRRRRILTWTGITFVVLTLIGVGTFAVLYQSIDIPDPNADFQTETSFVYYADGKTELGRYAKQDRDSIPFAEMPQTVKDAVVAAENRSFWTDNGIDPKGIVRAAFSNAQGNDQQGASTITQQYVKILYLTQERSYKRKIKEAIVSLKLHRQQSKEQILEGYLNTIYFGRGAYGVQAAAHAYFSKDAKELDLKESAVLASVINNPSLFDPANGEANKAALFERYRYVLKSMGDMGTAPAEVGDDAALTLPEFPEQRGESRNAGQRGHALEMIRKELARTGLFTEQEINGGGLRIYTTLSRKAMKAAEQGVREQRPEGVDGLHVAVASVQPGTGALRGFFAGQDYLKSQINWAITGGPPGSAFKPFALAAGINAGFSLKDTFQGNSPYVFPNGDEIKNLGEDGGTNYGRKINLIKATEDSVNTAYTDLTMSIPDGPQKVVDMANALGIPKKDDAEGSMDNLRDSPGLVPVPSVTLGFATVSPINMANAYATIANGGDAAEVYMIEKVVDRNGVERYSHKVQTQPALEEDISADVSYALQQVVKNGSGQKTLPLGRPAAGKTGTATNDDGEVVSSWFVGYTPQMSTAVMYVRGSGNDVLEGHLDPYFGGTYPALTWTEVMSRLLDGTEELSFPPPAYVDGKAPDAGHEPTLPPKPSPTITPSPTLTATVTLPPTEPPGQSDPPPSGIDCLLNPNHPQCPPTATPSPTDGGTNPANPHPKPLLGLFREEYTRP